MKCAAVEIISSDKNEFYVVEKMVNSRIMLLTPVDYTIL